MKLSIVIPCFNENTLLYKTHEEVTKNLKALKGKEIDDYEIVFVNDGSKDNTLDVLKELAEKDENTFYVSFSRNFGKESAMLAGLEHTKSDAVIIMDADLQHPPELIEQLVKEHKNGYDQVIAKRDRKGEKLVRKMLTKTYYKMVNNFMDIDLNDGVGDYRLLSRKAVESIIEMRECNRFSKGIFSWIGYKQKYITYQNNERIDGESKWSLNSLFNYAIDGVISFNSKPLRMLIYLGFGVFLLSFLYILTTFYSIVTKGIDQAGYFTLISSILLLGSLQMISIGIVGEYVGRIFYEVKQRPKYLVDETNTSKEKA